MENKSEYKYWIRLNAVLDIWDCRLNMDHEAGGFVKRVSLAISILAGAIIDTQSGCVNFVAEAGRVYDLESEHENGEVYFWNEDSETGQVVSVQKPPE